MKKHIAMAALLVVCLSAHSQFVDERANKGSAPAVGGVGASSGGAFDVRQTDMTMRDVLSRWATQNGWTHRPEHWAVDRDLPISGAADSSVFGSDFKGAVRKLTASSELTDRPVQPCFYSNRILRIVPRAELCDKTATVSAQ